LFNSITFDCFVFKLRSSVLIDCLKVKREKKEKEKKEKKVVKRKKL